MSDRNRPSNQKVRGPVRIAFAPAPAAWWCLIPTAAAAVVALTAMQTDRSTFAHDGEAARNSSPARGADALVRAIVLSHLPREYQNDKHWGQTKPRWDGLDVALDGLQVKTRRRWKDVNHGTWTHYRAWLIEPERDLQIHLGTPRTVAGQRTALEIVIDARLGATGRLAEWNRGLQLYSFHADADGRVRLTVTTEFQVKLDASRLPPDVQLVPRVTDAKLELLEFHLQRVSSADGPLVRKLGDSLRDDIDRELNDRRQKIVEKINRAIDKNSGKLRFSAYDLVAQGWDQWVRVPEPDSQGPTGDPKASP